MLEAAHVRVAPGAKLLVKGNSQEITAFLKLCAGLVHPRSGTIRLGGELLAPYNFSHSFLERGALAWVPSGGGLLVNHSLLANVALPLRFIGSLSRNQAEEQAREWLDRAGLGNLAERRPHSLSPQERWLGALARSLASGAELWLVDPPQGGLSPVLRKKAWELLAPVLENPAITALLAEDGPWLLEPPREWLQVEEGILSCGSTV